MDALSLLAFAGALAILFITPGPGNVAMVARTLDDGPVHGYTYGAGIITGDIFWMTVAVTGLSALTSTGGPWDWVIRLVGAGILIVFAARAFWSFAHPAPAGRIRKRASHLGLAATYMAGVAMPLTNPKPIVFYLSFMPAFFDLSAVTPLIWLTMAIIMILMYIFAASLHVLPADRARDWLQDKGVKRWADFITGIVMLSVALILLIR